jgi:hypothetical protein
MALASAEPEPNALADLLLASHRPGAFNLPIVRSHSMSRSGQIRAQNEMEPEEGWNAENLFDLMEESEEAAGGPTTAEIYDKPVFNVKDMAGITEPMGFWDPIGFTDEATEGKIRFYREVELKHGRVGMLAALGFLVGEQFHPLFGGNIDVPAYLAFQQTPLQQFWGPVVLAIGVLEIFSVFSFNSPAGGEPWSIRSDHEPGNFGFDPLGLKPDSPAALKVVQNQELNHCRLGMIAAAGMIAQEYVTGQKLF